MTSETCYCKEIQTESHAKLARPETLSELGLSIS